MMCATTNPRLPSFSLVLETVNLELADIGNLRRSLESVAGQDLSPGSANEIVMVESGEVPENVLAALTAAYPWLTIFKVAAEIGYEEAKMAGVKQTTGDVVVFFDADCVYEPGWLRGLIEGLAERPDIGVLAGETMIKTDSVWGIVSSILFVFEFYTGAEAIYEADRFHFNNVAFRRTVLERVPPPMHLPVYRLPMTYYSALLRESGYIVGRQPKSRARHEAPNGLAHFFWRFLLFGLDGINVQKLPWPGRPAGQGNVPASQIFLLRRLITIGAGHAAKVGRRLARLICEAPIRVLYLPLVLPLVLGGGLLMILGFLSGMLAPKFLPFVMPASMKRGNAYADRPGE